MKDQFVPWELEARLISLGFDRNKRVYLCDDRISKEEGRTGILWQQTFDWFRINKGFDSWSERCRDDETYVFQIPKANFNRIQGYYNTYEEVREACLLKLIELVELNQKK